MVVNAGNSMNRISSESVLPLSIVPSYASPSAITISLLARGSEAVEEFLGYPVNMSEAECVLEEYLNNLSDEDLANAFFETL